jgi:hypothetical protein
MCNERFEGFAADSCNVGCKQESALAQSELEKWGDDASFPNAVFGSMDSAVGLMNLFKQLDSMFSSEPVPQGAGEGSSSTDEEGSWNNNWPLVQGLLPLFKFGDKEEETQDAAAEKGKNAIQYNGLFGRPDGHEMRRGYPEDNFPAVIIPAREIVPAHDVSGEGLMKKHMRAMWNDRHTVQVLLITSISACLFAVLWLLLNSGNDPIVQINPRDAADNPPAYEIVVEGDLKKKHPILIVAEAPPLPMKIPLEMPSSAI